MSTNYGYTGTGTFDLVNGTGCVGWALTAMPESGTLNSITIGRGSTAGTTQPRIGLYKGGTTGDPTGATLLHDFGQLTGTTANAAETINASSEALTTGDVLWILFKMSSTTSIKATGSNGVGNFVNQQGSSFLNGQISGTASAAFPGSISGGNGLDQGTETPLAYITYTATAVTSSVPRKSSQLFIPLVSF